MYTGSFLGGLQLSLGYNARAETQIGFQNQRHVNVGNAGPALPVQIDEVFSLRFLGARGRLDSRQKRGIINGIHGRVGEKRDFGFDRAEQHRDVCRNRGASGENGSRGKVIPSTTGPRRNPCVLLVA
jgi:hypothetical protein